MVHFFRLHFVSLDKIKQLEQKFNQGIELPKAFREFLFLAGDFNNFGFDDIQFNIKFFQKISCLHFLQY